LHFKKVILLIIHYKIKNCVHSRFKVQLLSVEWRAYVRTKAQRDVSKRKFVVMDDLDAYMDLGWDLGGKSVSVSEQEGGGIGGQNLNLFFSQDLGLLWALSWSQILKNVKQFQKCSITGPNYPVVGCFFAFLSPHCKDHYRVNVMVPSCLHTYQLHFGFWTDYNIGVLSVW
jgi:hypothetical protein